MFNILRLKDFRTNECWLLTFLLGDFHSSNIWVLNLFTSLVQLKINLDHFYLWDQNIYPMFWVVYISNINPMSWVRCVFLRYLPKWYFHRDFWYIRGTIKVYRRKLLKDFLLLGMRCSGENQLRFSVWWCGSYFLFASLEYNSLCLEILSFIAFGARNWSLMT